MNNNSTIKTYRLTRWIPALVISIFLLLMAVQLINEYRDRQKTIITSGQQALYQAGTQLAHSIEYALANNDVEQAQSEITQFSLRQDAHFAALIDSDQSILVASSFAWNRQPTQHYFTPAERALMAQAQTDKKTLQHRADNLLTVVVPLQLTPATLFQAEETAPIVWLQTDLQAEIDQASSTIFWHTLPIFLAFIAAILLLIFFIKKWIIHPLSILKTLAQQLQNHQTIRSNPLRGNTHQADVAVALINAGQQLNQQISAVSEREKKLDITLQSIGDAVIVTDHEGLVTLMNAVACRLTGWPMIEALGQPLSTVFDIYQASTAEKMISPVTKVLETGETVELADHTLLKARNGEQFYISDSAAPIRNNLLNQAEITGVILVFQNVTQQYLLRQKLTETVDFLQNLLRLSPCVTYVMEEIETTPVQFKLIYISESVLKYSGKTAEYWLSHPFKWTEYVHADDLQNVLKTLASAQLSNDVISNEFRFRHHDGDYRVVQDFLNNNASQANEPKKIVGVMTDVTKQREAEQQIHFLAHHDALTHLPNRALLADRIKQAMVSADRHHHKLTLFYMDLDRFKFINDSLGHIAGDKLLIEVAKRLTQQMREQDTICRTGGDEFIILLPDTDADGAAHVAHKLIEQITLPFEVEGSPVFITSSIGISVFPDNGVDAETLNKHADSAMYRAKNSGRNQYQFFTAEMHSKIIYKLELEQALRFALQRDELFLMYQPIIHTETQIIIGAEALLRWQHPQLGLISPLEFIPIAEETGLINSIGQWILDTAIAEGKKWLLEDYQNVVVAINLSAVQFNNPRLIETIVASLEHHQLPPQYLELEITESVAMFNIDLTIKQLRALADVGIKLSLDDFGTGYSSLSYLKKFPIDTLKIDQSFVFDMLEDLDDAAIVDAVITLARALGLKTLAEGVETQAHVDALKTKGCDAMQGFFFSRPLLTDDFIALLKKTSTLN